jgi:hypothetical protein
MFFFFFFSSWQLMVAYAQREEGVALYLHSGGSFLLLCPSDIFVLCNEGPTGQRSRIGLLVKTEYDACKMTCALRSLYSVCICISICDHALLYAMARLFTA